MMKLTNLLVIGMTVVTGARGADFTVNTRATGLRLEHSCPTPPPPRDWRSLVRPEPAVAFRYVVRYADGAELPIVVRWGEGVEAAQRPPWIGPLAWAEPGESGRYVMHWPNPWPDKTIVSVRSEGATVAVTPVQEKPTGRSYYVAPTGESTGVNKKLDPLPEETPLADRKNMVFAGTVIASGRGEAVVVATGMKSELGKIATMVQEAGETLTPLQVRLKQFSKLIIIVVLSVMALVFALGIYVPVPMDSETVMEAVLGSLFAQARYDRAQLSLFDESSEAVRLTKLVHKQWGAAADREKESRSRFAQRAIKPEEIERELAETDSVLGRPEDVGAFLKDAAERIGFGFRRLANGVAEIQTAQLPAAVQQRLGNVPPSWKITFESPTPEDVTFIGRNHPLIEGLAEHLFDLAFHPVNGDSPAARCGVICTDAVERRTTLFLLRLRFLVYEADADTPTLAEETMAWGFQGSPPKITALPATAARELLDNATPIANVDLAEKRRVLAEVLPFWSAVELQLRQLVNERATALQESHHRVRPLLKHKKARIEPHFPPDLLGVLVLIPKVQGVKK